MYLLTVILLMFVAPVGSIYADHSYLHTTASLIELAGKWFVFWSAGVRLFAAGLRQFFQPRFTSEQILGIKSDDVLPFVRELGVANFATGIIGIASLAKPSFTLPVAIAAGTFFGVAGMRHLAGGDKTGNMNIAMVSDLFVFLVLAAYVVFVGWA
jgi:hypothetical protein